MKSLVKNVFVAIVTKLLMIVSSVVAQKFVLQTFGSEINGLTSSVSQFLLYFTLLESGIGLASIQALYKPLSEKKHSKIDGILSATTIQYRKVGFCFLALSVTLSALMPVISHSSLSYYTVFIITLLMSFASVMNYLFIGKYQVLLNADKRVYIIHTLDAVLGIGFSVLRIVMINVGFDIIAVQTAALLSPIIRIIFLKIYVKKKYPYLTYQEAPDMEAIGKRKHVLVHQIFGMVTLHAAVTIITVFSTLSQVSIYSVYNLIYHNISNLVTMAFSTAIAASLGHLYEQKRQEFSRYYHLYEIVFNLILFGAMSAVFVMTIPFVQLYTHGVKTVEGVVVEYVDYVDYILALLFLISILFSTVRLPAVTLINAAGKFEETKNGAIVEAILSVAVAVPGFLLFDLRGLMVGTCVALAYRAFDVQIFVYKKVLNVKIAEWIKKMLVFGGLTAAYILFFKFVIPIDVNVNSWIGFFVWGVICSICAVIWFLLGAVVFYRKELVQSLRLFKNRG